MPSSSLQRRVLAGLLAMAMLTVVTVAPAIAHESRSQLPTRIELPDGFQPEGIESRGRWLFAGSLVDGAICRGSATSGEGDVFVDGVEGLAAAGLHLDR